MSSPLPRTVKALGLVSFLTDASSEMIYPLLPSFLSTVLKAGPAYLGVIEGVAEATASALKLVAGRLSDRAPRRKPFVVFGYGLSTLVRPLIALAAAPWHVLAVRVADRVGKGTRGAPRDAILAAVTPVAERGRAYSFHRAMDHAGAVVGPLLASAALWVTGDLRLVFALAIVPGLLAMAALVFGVDEPEATSGQDASRTTDAAPADSISSAGPAAAEGDRDARRRFRVFLAALAIFSLGNSADAFLLLRAQEAGVPLVLIPLLWTFHHVVKSGASTFGGAWSDRAGRRTVIALGWAVYAIAYVGFAFASGPYVVWLLFAVYGLFHALTEGPEKALVADLAPANSRGWAFGLYHAVTGAMLLPASVLTGALWQVFGAKAALGTGAALAALAAATLCLVETRPTGAR